MEQKHSLGEEIEKRSHFGELQKLVCIGQNLQDVDRNNEAYKKAKEKLYLGGKRDPDSDMTLMRFIFSDD